MKLFLFFLLLILALFFEVTFIQMPLVLLVLFIIEVVYQEEWILPVGLLAGLLLDGLTFHQLGSSSIFFVIFLFLVFLYERKFELRSIWFVISMAFIGSFFYFFFFGHVYLLLQLFSSVTFSVVLFILLSLIHPLPDRDTLKTWKR